MKFLSILLLFITSLSIAQTDSDKSLAFNDRKFSLGWFYSPEVAYRFLSEGDNADATTSAIIESRNDIEIPRFGQSASLFLDYRFNERLSIEAGFITTDYGEAQKPTDLVYAGDPETPIGTVNLRRHLSVHSIPINLRYNWGRFQNTTVFTSLGVSPGMFHKYRSVQQSDYNNGSKITYVSYSVSAQDNYTSFILSAQISSGLDIKYNRKGSIRIAPVFRMTTTSVTKDTPIRGHYFNAGIEFGTVYTL